MKGPSQRGSDRTQRPADRPVRGVHPAAAPAWARPRPLIIAHRGASALAPENTLDAFTLARRCGAHMVELDIHQTKDRRLVVMHDATLTRTAGLRAAIANRTWAEITRLEAGAWFAPRFRGARIPTLEKVFAAIGPRMAVNIELKSGSHPYPGLESRLIALIRRRGWTPRVLISSFHVRRLERIRRLAPRIALGVLVHPWSADVALMRARRLRALSVHPPARVVTRTLVSRLHAEGFLVFPYTVDRATDKARLIRMGVDGFFTNRP